MGTETYGGGPGVPVPGAEVRETHSGVVVLLGDRAYKLKKPVDLGFLDFGTVERRAAACHRELVLNRRLAPDVYLGVLEVRDAAGQVCEHLVEMRRMPEDRRLATLARSGADMTAEVHSVARVVAAFHAGARTDARVATSGSAAALERRWADNLVSLRAGPVAARSPGTVEEIGRLALEYVRGRGPLLQARIDAGLVRDGHGDLLADDIFCLADGPRILDCLDFSDALRWMDVLDDVACLAMDLERLGAPRSAQQLLEDYAEFSGTRQPDSLRHHYVAYRATMRAKVTAIRATQEGPEGGAALEEAVGLCRLGLAHLRTGRVRLVLVGGAPGTGKTTVAGDLGDRLGAVLVSSDRERKQLAGTSPGAHRPSPLGQGIYTPEWTRRTYEAMVRRAGLLLGQGESVVVDATFGDPAWRGRFRAAAGATRSAVVELECRAPEPVVTARLRARAQHPDALSDADAEVGRALAAQHAPWPQAHGLDTSQEPDVVAALAERRVREG